MKDGGKTEKKLRKELKTLKSRLAKLEKTEAKREEAEEALQTERNKLINIMDTCKSYEREQFLKA